MCVRRGVASPLSEGVSGALHGIESRLAEKTRMNDTANHPGLDVLRSFFAEMHDWEVEAYRAQRAIDWETVTQKEVEAGQTKLRKAAEAIFERYCEVGSAAKRFKGGLSFGKPPRYDPEQEVVLSFEVKRTKLIVETQQNSGWRFKKRYELVERNGTWKIRDNSKYAARESANWKADIL
jgi:hypothetical protein